MELTPYQQDMLDGRYGKGKAMAIQIQKAIGEGFRAERMVPITKAHVALSAQEAGYLVCTENERCGCGVCRCPNCEPGLLPEVFPPGGACK